jgi:dTMP kinase
VKALICSWPPKAWAKPARNRVVAVSKLTNRLIAIEGLDASGKSTQADLLVDAFRRDGATVAAWSFPRYETFFGQRIRALLDGKESVTAATLDPKSMALWFAMDRWHAVHAHQQRHTDIVILNRWVLSNAVYQGARAALAEGLLSEGNGERSGTVGDNLFDWVLQLEFETLGLPKPAATVLLDISVEESMRRATNRAAAQGATPDVYEGASGLLLASKRLYQRAAAGGHGQLINVDAKSAADVHAEVWAAVTATPDVTTAQT